MTRNTDIWGKNVLLYPTKTQSERIARLLAKRRRKWRPKDPAVTQASVLREVVDAGLAALGAK